MESSEDHDHDQQPTSEKLITTTDGGDDNKVTSIVKSYECNFCKRGFSNAQALGGHMNIHRKDKAKLKQQSNSSSKLIITTQQPQLDIIHQHQILNRSNNVIDPINLPYWNNVSHHHDHSQSREGNLVLPLFVESADSREPLRLPEGSSPEIDLELRLGNDPQHDYSSTGTRKFL